MNNLLLIATLLVAALATGCKPSAERPASQISGTTAQQLNKAQAVAQGATPQMQDYTLAQKTEFVALVQAQLAKSNRSLGAP